MPLERILQMFPVSQAPGARYGERSSHRAGRAGILPDRDIRRVHHDAQTSGQTGQVYREGESRCHDSGAFKKEKDKEY